MALPTIHLVGNMTADTELRFTQSGKAIAKVRVACNDRKKDPNTGDWVDGTVTFLTCTLFDKRAEAAAELIKGQRVMVSGRLAQRSWEDDNGNKRTDFEVLVDELATVMKADAQKATTAGADPWAESGSQSSWGSTPAQDNEPPF